MSNGIYGQFREECSPSYTMETSGYRYINGHIDSLCPLIEDGYTKVEFDEVERDYSMEFCDWGDTDNNCKMTECKNKSLQECISDSNCRFGIYGYNFSDYRCQPDESNSDQAEEIPPCDEIFEDGDVNALGYADCWCGDSDEMGCSGVSSPFQGGGPNFCKWKDGKCVPKYDA